MPKIGLGLTAINCACAFGREGSTLNQGAAAARVTHKQGQNLFVNFLLKADNSKNRSGWLDDCVALCRFLLRIIRLGAIGSTAFVWNFIEGVD